MKTLIIQCKNDSNTTMIPQAICLSGENLVTELTLVYDDALTGWNKACDFVMGDGSKTQELNLGIANTVTIPLISSMTVRGLLQIQPWAVKEDNGETQIQKFNKVHIRILDSLNVSEDTAQEHPDEIAQLLAQLGQKVNGENILAVRDSQGIFEYTVDGENWQAVSGGSGSGGADGKSAYEIALENGFIGTETEWLAFLKGEKGEKGDRGDQGPAGPAGPRSIVWCLTGIAATGTNRVSFLADQAYTISKVKIYSDTAPAGAALICDINKNGTTIFTTQSTRPQITAGSSTGADTIPQISSLVEGDRLTLDVDQIGSTVAGGNNLTVTIVIQ